MQIVDFLQFWLQNLQFSSTIPVGLQTGFWQKTLQIVENLCRIYNFFQEILQNEFMAKADEYCQKANILSPSLGLATQQALAKKIDLKLLTNCTKATPPRDSEIAGTSVPIWHQWQR